jgi:NitT/TauT family transport system ATP-binding protein
VTGAARAAAPAAAAVSCARLSIAYEGRPVLHDIDLEVQAGEFVSLVGPSGCGKTTLLNVLAGLPTGHASGSAQVLGGAPQPGSPHVAYMLARDSLLPWRSALGNAAFGLEMRGVDRKAREARAAELLGRVGLGEVLHALPKALSHGMRQRVALARTFAVDAPVLLMDEPFGALDAQTKIVLQDLLLALTRVERRTVLFVTHDLAEAVSVSDRVVVLTARPGRIVADVAIDLPRPRHAGALQRDPAFHALTMRVWEHLEAATAHG